MPTYATDATYYHFIFFMEMETLKMVVFFLINGTQYAMPKYGGMQYARPK